MSKRTKAPPDEQSLSFVGYDEHLENVGEFISINITHVDGTDTVKEIVVLTASVSESEMSDRGTGILVY